MKKLLLIFFLILLFPVVSYGTEIQAQDLVNFTSNLSSIISFFAGCLAIIAFVAGVNHK